MAELADLISVLELDAVGPGRFRGENFQGAPGGVVFGGQIQAQIAVAAAKSEPGKEVKSIHTVFARGGDKSKPLDLSVDVIRAGRSVSTLNIAVAQDEQTRAQAIVLMNVRDPDLIRHQADPPKVEGPAAAKPHAHGSGWWDIRIDGGVDFQDPHLVGPPELNIWSRFPGAPSDPETGRALLAYAADGFLIATAMRPHEGVGQALAHVTISTTVLSQTLTFHEPFDADQFLLLAHESPYSGAGRSYGRANVFTEDGELVASFVQENMIRDFPEGRTPTPGQRAKF